MKSLVVYTSVSGGTRTIANEIASEIGASLVEVKGDHLHTGVEDVRIRTEPGSVDMEQFDLLFLGTPIWMWNPSPVLMTYLKKLNVKGKRLALFSTSEGDVRGAMEKLKSELEDNEVISIEDFLNPKLKEEEMNRSRTWAKKVVDIALKQR
ncbi:MAG: flavodoxin [Candidatus Thermoplasmatota archaeon]|nr:flavodoxin [Candidatus Thermoplasmatota archaeon]